MALQAGATLGRYQIVAPLGQGGMASVYKAYLPSLERTVALKVMRAGFAEDPDFLERFRREAKSIARFSHPNIVQVFDFDDVDGRYFMAMEYLEGGTLRDRLVELAKDGQRLPAREVTRIVSEVADALSYAHSFGIIHRDVKPSNVMLTRDGRSVVTDFGIAKVLSATQQTQAGVGMGTPEYMSPEQGQGITIDHRADIYSLGIMAFEMLAGRVPYIADTPMAIVLAHIRDQIPAPSTVNGEIGPVADRVLMRALAKQPEERYGSATELAQALSRAIAEDERGGTMPTMVVPGARGTTAPTAAASPAVAAPAAAAPAAGPGGLAARLVTGRRVAILGIVVVLMAVYGLFAKSLNACPPAGPWPLPPGC
ncbi:MAG: hypothetical protein A3H36_00025 [Chloroflexi bacterium RIFCSPLOWO2_02_FULL_71_16]|nr:MAG: hypothetical protein A3H36_00025 [Chloroflexi bacterium RIFCSPLOWO2_02_FULL_71_16]